MPRRQVAAYACAMADLGLFPLRLVLFPGERLPLHIFEPRYRELIGECLDTDGEFGILQAAEDGLREVGTRARVAEVLERLEDGRLNIVVEGRSRFRLVELTEGRSFHTGRVEAVEDDPEADPPADADAARALVLLGALVEDAGVELELPPADDPELSFAVAARVELELDEEQELLELRSEGARLARLVVLLEAAAERQRIQKQAAGRAKTNGHLPHTPKLP